MKIELKELQEFTELERQCEETIDSQKKVNFEICFTIFALKIDQELQEFTELERQCEETIDSQKKVNFEIFFHHICLEDRTSRAAGIQRV